MEKHLQLCRQIEDQGWTLTSNTPKTLEGCKSCTLQQLSQLITHPPSLQVIIKLRPHHHPPPPTHDTPAASSKCLPTLWDDGGILIAAIWQRTASSGLHLYFWAMTWHSIFRYAFFSDHLRRAPTTVWWNPDLRTLPLKWQVRDVPPWECLEMLSRTPGAALRDGGVLALGEQIRSLACVDAHMGQRKNVCRCVCAKSQTHNCLWEKRFSPFLTLH